MDLGNLNLRILTPSANGEGGGKQNKKNPGEAPAEGGFAALLGSLLTVAKGQKSDGAETPSAQGVLVKHQGAPGGQNGVPAQDASAKLMALVSGAAVDDGHAAAAATASPEAGAAAKAAAPVQSPAEAQAPGKPKPQNPAKAAETPLPETVKPLVSSAEESARQTTAVQTADAAKTGGAAKAQQQPSADQLQAARPHFEAAPERNEIAAKEAAASPAPSASSDGAPGRVTSVSNAQQGAQNIVSQVAQQVTYALRGGLEQIRFQLHPAELGQVSVQLKIRDGAAKVIISADNPVAVESMRQAASALHQTLQTAGMQLDRENLQFQQQGGSDQFAFGDEAQREGGRGAPEDHGSLGQRADSAEPDSRPQSRNGLFL